MPHITDLTHLHFIEGSTPRLEYEVLDADKKLIVSPLTTHTVTIYDEALGIVTPGFVDGTDIQGLLGNIVTNGKGVWNMPATATVKIGDDEFEDKIIAMKWTYGSGRVGRHWIRVRIYEQPAYA